MKKVVLLLILSLISCLVYAQNKQLKSLVLQKGEVFSIVFDYSKLESICGLTLEDLYSIEENYEEGFKEAEKRFIMEANNTGLNRVQFTPAPNHEHVLIVYPTIITKNGNIKGTAIITDNEGKELVSLGSLRVRGGRIGSFFNLMGDGYENLGHAIYNMISQNAKFK